MAGLYNFNDQSCCQLNGEICQFKRLISKIFLVKWLGLLWPVVAANQRLSDGADCVSRNNTMAMLGRLMLIISARCCRRKITTSFLYNFLVSAIVRPPCRGHHRPQQINKEQQPLGHVLRPNEFSSHGARAEALESNFRSRDVGQTKVARHFLWKMSTAAE